MQTNSTLTEVFRLGFEVRTEVVIDPWGSLDWDKLDNEITKHELLQQLFKEEMI